MDNEELKKLSESLVHGLTLFIGNRYDMSVFVCPECGAKILADKKSNPFCLKCYKVMVFSNG